MWMDTLESDIPKDYQKLKQQNLKLRNELKQINDFLTKQIEKKQESQISHRIQQPLSTELKEDTLKVELQNAQKQIKIQLKQIQVLQNRQEMLSLDNIMQLQSELKRQSEFIKELEQEKKLLMNINGKQEKHLKELMQDDLIKGKIEQLENENNFLKQKLQSISKQERSFSVQIPKTEIQLKPIQLTQKQQEIMKEKELIIQQLQQKMIEQERHIRILSNLKNQYDKQIGSMTHKIKSLELQIQLMNQQLQDRNFELNKRNHLLPNLSMRNARQNYHKLNHSIDINTEMSKRYYQHDNGNRQIQYLTDLQNNNTIPMSQLSVRATQIDQSLQTQEVNEFIIESEKKEQKIYKRIEMLGKQNKDEQEFQDQSEMHKLHNLKLFWKNDFLVGLQALYIDETQIKNGKQFCKQDISNLSSQCVELSCQDSIKSISFGFQDEKIKYIVMTSFQNCVMKFGQEIQDLQNIQVYENEYLGSVYCSYYQDYISSIGFEILDAKQYDKEYKDTQQD